jgi:hypothetical protein
MKNGRQYVFDRYFFIGVVVVLLSIFLLIVLLNGGLGKINNFYVTCNNTFGNNYMDINKSFVGTLYNCENPLYNTKYCRYAWAGACEEQYIPNGFVYGTPPTKYLQGFTSITLSLLLLAFTFNHFLYNTRWKK